jgi:hypothetical protein
LRNRFTVAVIGVLAAFALACGGSGNSGSDEEDKGTAASEKGGAVGLNQPARDGKFEFTVSGMKCGTTSVGTEMVGKTAQGQFCMVNVAVKNIGKEAQTFSGSSQKAFDAKGTEFSDDITAEMYANQGNTTWLEQINPGNSVKGKIIFDVPKGAKLTALELHDSPFSGGVKVNLS